jgi:hypothetical protein
MSGAWDAQITLVYLTDNGGSTAIDTIRNSAPLDVLANVLIGETLMQVVSTAELFVSVRNLSQLAVPLRQHKTFELTPKSARLRQTFEVHFEGGWAAEEGDVLDVVASLKVRAGVHVDHTHARGPLVVVID